ncbi:MAG: HDOD domain-containing protein [Phycisphaeraceae bacterium]|nr:HDOD domain-containing protein [Phycisphaeraceae bacterium]
MNPEVLERVLNCRQLPSLPAVAMRVVELTADQSVSMKALAETIQNDQALSAKILRTVNSSLFGLRKKCSNINQAITFLGMSAVKTLALGFSLVTAIKDASKDFDLTEHWRRALFTAVAAKNIAARSGVGYQEECFLGGLLQDVGMIVLLQTLGEEYAKVVAMAEGEHRQVGRLELEHFGLQHPDLGAMLAQRWKLPDELVMPIKYHERPTAAPSSHASIVRAVGLGNIASDVLAGRDTVQSLRRFYERAEQWFGLTNQQADEVLQAITTQAREMSRLLSVATGEAIDSARVLEAAKEQLSKIEIPDDQEQIDLGPIYSMSEKSPMVDELTGLSSRERFEQSIIALFEKSQAGVGPMSVVLVKIDNDTSIVSLAGEEALDTAAIGVSGRLTRVFSPKRAVIARMNRAHFAVAVNGLDRSESARLAELVRQAVGAQPIRLIAARPGAPREIQVTVSVGVVTMDAASVDEFPDASRLVTVAEAALAAAERSGRNAVRVYQPKAA